MASSLKFSESLESDHTLVGNQFPICDRLSEQSRSMRLLERLASTLGVSVESFFAEAIPTEEATVEEIADLTRAFVAITDPIMRRYCVDMVRAAGAGRDGEDQTTPTI